MTSLGDISVYAPDQVPPEEIEIAGAYVPAHWVHLLEAQGWIPHPNCYGDPESHIGCDGCFMGLVPPDDTIALIAAHVGGNSESSEIKLLVREALVTVERARLRGGRDVLAANSNGGGSGGGVTPPVRGDDAAPGPAPDEAMEIHEPGVPDDPERGPG